MNDLLTDPDFQFLVLFGVIVLLVTIFKKKKTCPRCGEFVSDISIPKKFKQFWFGGYTCSYCSEEFDRKGRKVEKGKEE